MSVLNTMLRDLERRGVRPAQPLPARPPETASTLADASPLIQMTQRRQRVRPVLWLALALAAVAAFWLWRHPKPTVPAFGQRLTRPAPVAVPAPIAEAPAPAPAALPAPLPLAAPPLAPQAAAARAPSLVAPSAAAPRVMQNAPGPRSARSATPPEPAPTAAPRPVASHKPRPQPAQAATASPAGHPAEAAAAATPPAEMAAPVVAPVVAHSTKQSELVAATDLIERGRTSEAVAKLTSALAAHPDWADVRSTLAALQAEGGDRRQALSTLLGGVPTDPRRFAPIAAQLQAELQDPAGALETLARVPTESRKQGYHTLAAAVAQRAGQHQMAVTEYAAALAFDPANSMSWLGMGVSLQALGRQDDALAAYRNAAHGMLSADLRGFVESRIRTLQASGAAAPNVP